MTIFNMEDSSINEYINEHGGLRNKIRKNRDNAVKNYFELEDSYNNAYKNAISNKQKEKIKELYKKDIIKADKK